MATGRKGKVLGSQMIHWIEIDITDIDRQGAEEKGRELVESGTDIGKNTGTLATVLATKPKVDTEVGMAQTPTCRAVRRFLRRRPETLSKYQP